MACEIPVVTSRAGGLPEVIEHGSTGFLAPVGDVEGMASLAIEILSDAEGSARVGRAARKSVHNHFLPQQIVPIYEALYERLAYDAAPVQPNADAYDPFFKYADGI